MDWPFDRETDLDPETYLKSLGRIISTFDARTQDSGNVSYGLEAADRRWFVKTAGDPQAQGTHLSHQARIDLLLNARDLALATRHPALPGFHSVIQTAWGPALIYDWVAGEVLGGPLARKEDPEGPFQRFRRLPLPALSAALGGIIDLHRLLAAEGWVACDFYDGGLMHDFSQGRTWVIDLDLYRRGAFTNEMGRMFGSTRFMAPEEFELGAKIDERTTVFNLGRAISVFMGGGTIDPDRFRGEPHQYQTMIRACEPDPGRRFPTVAQLAESWLGAS
jgi:serine/threonine-protein kinase